MGGIADASIFDTGSVAVAVERAIVCEGVMLGNTLDFILEIGVVIARVEVRPNVDNLDVD
jgi:hypothetical protein